MELIDLLSVPSNWSRKYDEYEVHEEEISQSSMEGLTAMMELMGFRHITRLTRVQNPYLYHRYQLRKCEYTARGISFQEKSLLHDTSQMKVASILKNNLDWRLVNRSKFGKGVSFSPDPHYANKQSSRANGTYRAMIIAKVLVGQCQGGHYATRLPSDGYDTTIGNGTKVYVKYYDDEFYPEYVAYYNN